LIDIISDSCIHVIFEISPETSNEELRRMNKDQRLFYSNYELEQCLDYIGTKQNCKVQVFVSTQTDIKEAINRYYGSVSKG